MKKLLLLLLASLCYCTVEAQVHTYYRHKEVDTAKGTTRMADQIQLLRLVITYDYCYECDEYGNRKNPSAFDMDIYRRVRADENGNTIYKASHHPFVYVISADKTRVNSYWDNPSVRHMITVYDKQRPTFEREDVIMY